ncbi:MAG: acyl-CoA dehydrogenase family protein [Trueperaceae bacterium]|nr:MAG: acyl-CoA dehydrogenase family protein [Trueperaceae bacterium]
MFRTIEQSDRQLWFELSDDQKAIIGPLREFLKTEIAPGAVERDKSGDFPTEIVTQLGELGVLGMQVPECYGGAELDTSTFVHIIEEIAAVDGSLCLTVASHNSLCLGHLLAAGSEDQHATYVPELASGKKLGAWALTEPSSGSDAASLQTRAVAKGNTFTLNGSKSFITQGTVAGTYVVIARSDPPQEGRPRTHGISAFVIDGDSPGLIRGKPEQKLGLRSSDTTPITLDNVVTSTEGLLGQRGEAFTDVLEVLDGGRIGIAAMGIGLGRAALEIASRYALERRQFGTPIAHFQAIGFKIADLVTELEAARLMTLRAAALKDAGRNYTMAASQAKLKGSTVGVEACDAAIQILGGYGYIKEYEVERMWRDARLTRIGEGTDEIQRLIISKEYLKRFH